MLYITSFFVQQCHIMKEYIKDFFVYSSSSLEKFTLSTAKNVELSS